MIKTMRTERLLEAVGEKAFLEIMEKYKSKRRHLPTEKDIAVAKEFVAKRINLKEAMKKCGYKGSVSFYAMIGKLAETGVLF